MLKTLQDSKIKKFLLKLIVFFPVMRIKIKKKTYSELIGDNTVITCGVFHNRKPEEFDLLQFGIQLVVLLCIY